MSGSSRSADALAPHLALPNRLLAGPAVRSRTSHALRALLRSDFAVRSESIGCSGRRIPAGLTPQGGPHPLSLTEPFQQRLAL
ncbi:MAG: hypothetical protein K940chlam2_00722 [Chlamydiae bacterium]|nr:hypothetical protein [Chlamydiota bacterium]